jgi:hypothetical protein
MRKGKIYAWNPSYEDATARHRTRRRLKVALEEFLPDAAADVGAELPKNLVDSERRKEKKKRKREKEKEWILPHLASPSPPQTTIELAPKLALPQSYIDIMTSPAMRHSLGDDTIETGLQRTAGELLDGEKGLMQALGRLREVLRVRQRDVPGENGDGAEKSNKVPNGSHANGIHANGNANSDPMAMGRSDDRTLPLPHISDTDNLWRVTQELLHPHPQPTIVFSKTPAGTVVQGAAAASYNQPPGYQAHVEPSSLTPVHRLFTCVDGITLNAVPHASHPNFAFPPRHPGYPQTVKYNLDLSNQCRAVDDALERIAELLADCNEYKERLEEARARVADVARARKKVWEVVKERASREMDGFGV